jgi:hypothetical protein
MKWIGQHIYDLVARFRNDVYLEDLSTTTETNVLVVDSDGKVSKTTVITGDVTGVTAGSNITVTDPTGPVPTVALSTNVDVAGTLDVTGLGTFDASITVDGKISLNDGGYSVFVGEGAGLNDDASANRNVGVGYQALYSNTEGSYNTASGVSALYSNTEGYNNTASGVSALYSNTTGYHNTASGFQALYSNTEGYGNTANGYAALYSNTTGDTNTANGYAALYSNTTGDTNTAFGAAALYSNTTGNVNAANGYGALRSNTTGSANTANGYFALYSNTTGTNNIAVGSSAGTYITGGINLNTVTSNSVFLGTNTKALADSQTNQIVIGYDATGLGSNTAILGNSSITKTQLQGDVGIGTATPTAKLEINGSAENLRIISTTAGNTHIGYGSGTSAAGNYFSFEETGATYFRSYDGTTHTTRMFISGSGNVGIGTTSPDALLEISGNAGADPGPITNPTTFRITDAGNAATGAGDVTNPWGKIEFYSEDISLTGPSVQAQIASVYNTIYSDSSDLNFYTRASPAVPLSTRMTIDAGGDVGIGTTSPGSKLQVYTGNTSNANDGITLMRGAGLDVFGIKHRSNASGVYRGAIAYDAAEVMTFLTDGKVGIGITDPTEKLAVSGGNIEIADNTEGRKIGFDVGDSVSFNSTTIAHYGMSNAGNSEEGGITYSGYFGQKFFTNGTLRMVIARYGNVGIGTATPSNKLDIVGSLGRGAPVTKTTDFTVAATENWLIMNGTATITITLPTASDWTGRELMIKNIAAFTVVSASSNVKPIDTSTAATAILPATAGSWCTLVSDGTNWVTMMKG